jgi:undecaprenyl diphosphate synthase
MNCQNNLAWAIDRTKNNSGLTLILALSYSGRWEITQAMKSIARDVKEGKLSEADINEKLIGQRLQTGRVPDPELLIRTSGEMRVSNFLLWQIAYTELYITPTLWPDFRKEHLYEAIWAYQQRERRFGKTSEQLNPIE